MPRSVIKSISDLDKRDDLILVTDDQDVRSVKENVGGRKVKRFDSFFVKVGEGYYEEVWGFQGIIPYLYKDVEKII